METVHTVYRAVFEYLYNCGTSDHKKSCNGLVRNVELVARVYFFGVVTDEHVIAVRRQFKRHQRAF